MTDERVNRTGDRAWHMLYGAIAGFTVAAFVYLPVTLVVRHELDIPLPTPGPRDPRLGSQHIAFSYWVTWATSLVVLLLPGLVMLALYRSRRLGIGYLLAASIVGGLAFFAVANLELNGGITPSDSP